MAKISKQSIEPAYRKDSGMLVFDVDSYDGIIPHEVRVRTIVSIPPMQIGGNHSHTRTESFIAIGEGLELHWIDENGKKHVEAMNQNSELNIFTVYPGTAHAVRNNSANSNAILVEYADKLRDDNVVAMEQVI